MPYGLSQAGATFQRLIDKVIGPELLPYAYSYLDDIIIATETFEKHLEILEKVLARIKAAGLTINKDKSEFCREEVKYLGVLVNKDGFRPDPEKIQPIMSYPIPKNLRQLRRFLGMSSWYRKFLKNFATIAEPLTQLTSVKVKYIWTEKQQEAFEKIKALVASAPLLQRPDFTETFVIQTDASDTGIGAVLTQVINGEERVLEFASRVMSAAERNYSVTERECLAVIWAIRKFRPYVEGYEFKIITDHSSLKWLCKLQNATGRLSRWSLELQGYMYTVEHRKGALNHVPDALSRMYEENEPVVCAFSYETEQLDDWYKKMHLKVEEHPRKHPRWKVVGGKLYSYRPDHTIEQTIGDENAWKLVLPHYLRRQVIQECHDNPTSGHLGMEKTCKRVNQTYYWPRMQSDVEAYVRACIVCQQCKVEQRLPGGLMGKRIITRPWQVVATDIAGPMPRSKQGNNYVLVFEDLFTRYVEAFAIRKANGETIWKHLKNNVFLRWGIPETLLSDNGTEFKNRLIDSQLEEYGVHHELTPIYHPQANPVERVNRTLKTMIMSYIERDHQTWDEHLPELVFAYNTAIHSSTGESPAMLNMARQPPHKSTVLNELERTTQEQCEAEALEEWKSKLERIDLLHTSAAERADHQQDRQARYYDAKHRDVSFEIGDTVWKKNRTLSNKAEKISAKLAPKFTGPYIVMQKLGSNTYALMDSNGNEESPIAVQHLRKVGRDSSTEREEEEPQQSTNTIRDQEDAIPDASERQPANSGLPGDNLVSIGKTKKRGRPRKNAIAVNRETAKTANELELVSEAPGKRKPGKPKGSTKSVPEVRVENPSPRRTRAQRHNS